MSEGTIKICLAACEVAIFFPRELCICLRLLNSFHPSRVGYIVMYYYFLGLFSCFPPPYLCGFNYRHAFFFAPFPKYQYRYMFFIILNTFLTQFWFSGTLFLDIMTFSRTREQALKEVNLCRHFIIIFFNIIIHNLTVLHLAPFSNLHKQTINQGRQSWGDGRHTAIWGGG